MISFTRKYKNLWLRFIPKETFKQYSPDGGPERSQAQVETVLLASINFQQNQVANSCG